MGINKNLNDEQADAVELWVHEEDRRRFIAYATRNGCTSSTKAFKQLVEIAETIEGLNTSVARTLEGTWDVTGIPLPGIIVAFGENSFSISSRTVGHYEVHGDTAILTGPSFSGVFDIRGNTLVGDQITLVRRSPSGRKMVSSSRLGSQSV